MGTTDLDDIFESLRLRVQGISQPNQGRNEILADFKDGGNVHSGGESIIRTLAHVDVVIGVDRLLRAEFATEDLNRPVRNDLPGP